MEKIEVISLAIWALLSLGVFLATKGERTLHALIMATAVVMDLIVVAYVEYSNSAIEKVLTDQITTLQKIHVAFSLSAILMYPIVLVSGILTYRGLLRPKTHVLAGILTYVCRTGGLISLWLQ